MSDLSYTFELRPARREVTFFHALFMTYPSIIGRYLFRRRPSPETLFYLLFSPLLGFRNLANGILCTFPFCVDIPYRLTLHESHLSFGPDHEEALMANSYGSIEAVFRAGREWCVLLHDGYLVYLPPDEAGTTAVQAIEDRRKAQSGRG